MISLPLVLQQAMDSHQGQIPVPVVDIATELGMLIYETADFEDAESGSLQKVGEQFVIFLNANHPSTRKRFTIAHEIGHFVKHQEYFEQHTELVDLSKQPAALHRAGTTDPSEADQQREIEANLIAAAILMPEASFREAWEKTLSIEALAELFEVSPSAASWRVRELFDAFMI